MLRTCYQAIVWSGIACLCSAGCTERPYGLKSSVKKAPVTGIVMMNGEPLADAEVFFYTERFTGFGKTDSEGKYKLFEGAAIGPNTVFFSKLKHDRAAHSEPAFPSLLNDPMQAEIAEKTRNPVPRRPPEQLVPQEYTSETTSDLTIDVPAHGATDADFFF